MRIVIETDQPDDSQGPSRLSSETPRETVVTLDGGPAPAALLRQFGRIPQPQAPTQISAQARTPAQSESHPGTEPESTSGETEGGEAKLNPLRHGAALAAQRPESGNEPTARTSQ